LFVNVGLSAEDYLTPWRAEREMVLAAVVFLWLLTAGAGWISWRQYRAQMAEMQGRLAAARELELAQRDIRELNASLERRVEARTHELADANRQLRDTLEHLERTRDELLQREKLASLGAMVAGVAHELNTPIGNALLVASSLHEEAEDFADQCNGRLTRGGLDAYVEKTVHGAEMLLGNLRRAANLIASFKQLSIDQTSDQRRLFSIGDVCNEVVTALTPTLRKTTHRVELAIPDELTIDSYPGAFGQVLTNLITNAIDHAFDQREGGTVRIAGEALSPEEVRVIFSDDGRGMTPDVFRRVFDPFFTTKLGKGGSGIGMHLVYHLVTATLGGKIVGDSGPHGTSWVILLPVKAPVPPEGLDAPFMIERRS
jgi:signal transduction histidine kinase